MAWRFLLSPPADGAQNMALDELLLERAARTRETVLRIYTWSGPTLSFGRNQKAAGIYSPLELAANGIGVVRRPTGGRALLHDREITYSVTAPVWRSLRDAYLEINRLVADGLRRLGIDAQMAGPRTRALAPGPTPCFHTPSPGELVVDGRKLVGSAQWRTEHAFLQHGSILVADDQSTLPRLAAVPLPVIATPATLTELLGRAPAVTEVAESLFSAARERDWEASMLDGAELSEIALRTVANRYRDESWTWRR